MSILVTIKYQGREIENNAIEDVNKPCNQRKKLPHMGQQDL